MADSREEIRRKNKKVIKNVFKTVAGIGVATVAAVGIISSLQKDKVIEEQKRTIDDKDKEIEYLQEKEGNEVKDGKEIELMNENGEIICYICHSNKVTEILVPCGHYTVCSSCIAKLKENSSPRCPICKRRIDKAIKLYIN